MSENIQAQVQELAKFAQEQNFDERYLEYFSDIWQEAGVKDIGKMTIKDAERTMQVLSSSEASVEFIKAFYAQAVRQGMPSQVLEYIMQSDIDGDGRTLAQEIFVDGTDPFEADTPTPVTSHQKAPNQDFEIEI
jgi:hypothetical protein